MNKVQPKYGRASAGREEYGSRHGFVMSVHLTARCRRSRREMLSSVRACSSGAPAELRR